MFTQTLGIFGIAIAITAVIFFLRMVMLRQAVLYLLFYKRGGNRVPLETFLLFASAMAVNWEVGGSLSPTLATVGRTIRDRIEIGRRIQSNIAQSQLSTYFLLGLTYFIAAIVWRNNPDNMRQFLGTSVGQMFVAGSMVM